MPNRLLNRSFLELSGSDSKKLLQGLITNDINKLQSGNLLYAAMLSAQGKFLYDFFIFSFEAQDSLGEQKLLLDCHKSVVDELAKKLNFYKLRSQVSIKKNDDFAVFVSEAAFDDGFTQNIASSGVLRADAKFWCFSDPRNSKIGCRIYLQNPAQNSDKFDDEVLLDEAPYHRRRIENKIAEGVYDLTLGEDFILHFGFDNLSAVDYQKGCYIGQETTARMHYRGNTNKKIYQFRIEEFSDELSQYLQKACESLSESVVFSSKKIDLIKNCEIFWQDKPCGVALSAIIEDKKLYGLAIIKAPNQENLEEAFSNLTLLSSKIKIIG